MADKELHLSDQDLLLAADGELSHGRARQARAHLAACWWCRTRLGEMEDTIGDFVHVYRRTLDPQLPPAAGSRALLKAQLAEAAAEPGMGLWPRFLQFVLPHRAVAYVCVALCIAALGGKLLSSHFQGQRSASPAVPFANGAVPNRSLTPGATVPVAIGDVCSMAHEEVVRAVPTPLRQKVLQEYGIADTRAKDYEIDYLIAPGLGGAEDIHNLWPEPYTIPAWNAHVKDALEERLHQLVCDRKLDLRTAQRDIATNWIAAYKKYFHTNKPLSAPSHPTPSTEASNGALGSPVIRAAKSQPGKTERARPSRKDVSVPDRTLRVTSCSRCEPDWNKAGFSHALRVS